MSQPSDKHRSFTLRIEAGYAVVTDDQDVTIIDEYDFTKGEDWKGDGIRALVEQANSVFTPSHVVHNDHPLRLFDRTCPACTSESRSAPSTTRQMGWAIVQPNGTFNLWHDKPKDPGPRGKLVPLYAAPLPSTTGKSPMLLQALHELEEIALIDKPLIRAAIERIEQLERELKIVQDNLDTSADIVRQYQRETTLSATACSADQRDALLWLQQYVFSGEVSSGRPHDRHARSCIQEVLNNMEGGVTAEPAIKGALRPKDGGAEQHG